MAYIEHNFFPLKVFVRNEYMYQHKKGHGEFTPGVIMSVRCMPGQAALFQVLLENGVMRDKLPSHALLHEPKTPDPDLPFHFLQIWNCFSYKFTVLHLNHVSDTRVEVYMKDHKFYPGSYYATINWGCSDPNTDLTMSEDPEEHKSHHIILLDNGQIALQPNNRIKWYEPSFVTKDFPENPDYLVCNEFYNCEGFEKWRTEDSDRMFYDNE
jgi:hypothetical protein